MTHEAIIERLRSSAADPLWSELAISMVEALAGTSIDPASPTLLGDMRAVEAEHPKVSEYLALVPGATGPAASDQDAELHLSFLMMQVRAVINSQ